ncbi:hypothetical protein FEM48_Zijuj08G0187600 [Ziziphus jujuba var. spinosa]|uniref:Uncharacterized protein n=1 Tax=Ziziphus jujuba var. spinosa TaxID=714518 RepID=A0A978V0R4_ZIZJJ|nr:hypothetical protein FEM48_Zijuj08G0187600 [Ziziphus jujuba var. spinosa]
MTKHVNIRASTKSGILRSKNNENFHPNPNYVNAVAVCMVVSGSRPTIRYMIVRFLGHGNNWMAYKGCIVWPKRVVIKLWYWQLGSFTGLLAAVKMIMKTKL